MTQTSDKIRENFIEQVGLFLQGDGLPRIAGRLMGLLIFDGKPYSFGELSRELQVSRGSISTNARLLEGLGVITRVAMPGDRQDYYQLGDNPYETLMNGVIERARRAETSLNRTANALPASETAAAGRIRDYARFYGAVISGVEEASARFKADG